MDSCTVGPLGMASLTWSLHQLASTIKQMYQAGSAGRLILNLIGFICLLQEGQEAPAGTPLRPER